MIGAVYDPGADVNCQEYGAGYDEYQINTSVEVMELVLSLMRWKD